MTLSRFLVIAGFAVSALALLAVEWAARRPDSKIPKIGDVAAVVMRHEVAGLPIGRLAVLGFWLWLGWHFLAR